MRRFAVLLVALALVLAAPAAASHMDPGSGGLYWRAIPGASCQGGARLVQAYWDPYGWYPVQPYLYGCMI